MKKIKLLIILILSILCFFELKNAYAIDSFCEGTCQTAPLWENSPHFDIPVTYAGNCVITISFYKRYNPCRNCCEFLIDEIIRPMPACSGVTEQAALEFAMQFISENLDIITGDPLCIPDEGNQVEVMFYLSPCWKWETTLFNSNGQPIQQKLTPCEHEGCCVYQHFVEKVDGDLVYHYGSVNSNGVCTDNNPTCFSICE